MLLHGYAHGHHHQRVRHSRVVFQAVSCGKHVTDLATNRAAILLGAEVPTTVRLIGRADGSIVLLVARVPNTDRPMPLPGQAFRRAAKGPLPTRWTHRQVIGVGGPRTTRWDQTQSASNLPRSGRLRQH